MKKIDSDPIFTDLENGYRPGDILIRHKISRTTFLTMTRNTIWGDVYRRKK